MTIKGETSRVQTIAAAIANLDDDERRCLMSRVNNGMLDQISAAEAAEQKKVRLASVSAARAKAMVDLAASNTMAYLDGMLRRAGLPTVEKFAEAGPAAIDKLLASASRPLTTAERLEFKGRLHALRLA
jgi:hypothetical protein